MSPDAAERFLNLDATGWSAVTGLATAVLAVLAALAWLLGRAQLQATLRTWKEESRPYVVVDFVPGIAEPKVIDFVVRNIGRTPAYDVRIDWAHAPARVREADPPFVSAKLFTKPIQMLAPGQEHRLFFDTTIDRQAAHDAHASLPAEYPVMVSYRNSGRSTWAETFELDPDLLQGSMHATVFTTHDIGRALRQIASDLHGAPILNAELMVAVESRAQYEARTATEQAAAHARHRRLVDRLLPDRKPHPANGPDSQRQG